jgi:hypothetical protein
MLTTSSKAIHPSLLRAQSLPRPGPSLDLATFLQLSVVCHRQVQATNHCTTRRCGLVSAFF